MLDLFLARFALRQFRPIGGGGQPYSPGGGGDAGAAGGAAGSGVGGAAASGGGGAAGGGGNSGGAIYNQAAWLLQPSSFLDIDKVGYIALPAIGVTAIILQFQIPSGRNAKLAAIGMDFVPNGATTTGLFIQGVLPFQLAFKLNTSAVGTSFGDFALFNYLPGSVSAPMPIAGLMVKESQTVTLSVTNVSVVVAAPTQFVGAHIQGYSYPKNLEPKNMGYQ
jgi:hypothetical protein